MVAGKANAAQAPTALGTLLQASTYGMTIPTIYGTTMSPLLAIWAANYRKGDGSGKKLKSFSGKAPPTYVENIDFLIAKNPVLGILQMWNNGSTIPLTFTSQSFSMQEFGSGTFTITDSHFYAVVAVTYEQNYSVTFDDYGGQGPVTLTGSYEVPLWNELQTGPDPTNPNSYRSYPNVYRWEPNYGNVVHVDGVPQGQIPTNPTTTTLKVYYAQLMDATSFMPPIQKMRLAFEPELGSGTEYSDADLSSQQIVYPMYAGMGSSDIDLGTSGAIPELQAEVQSKFALYPAGDADFADMIEDIIKSGIAQASIGADPSTNPASYSRVEHGLSGYNLPGTVQKKVVAGFENSAGTTVTFNMPNTAGNVLVAFVDVGNGSSTGIPTPGISDSLGNTWVSAGSAYRSNINPDAFVWAAFYCVNCLAGPNTITFTNVTGFDFAQDFIVMELAGVDTFDGISFQAGINPTASITTTVQPGLAEHIIAFGMQLERVNPPAVNPGSTVQWPVTVNGFIGGDHDGTQYVQERTVSQPGTYSLGFGPNTLGWSGGYIVLVAFKATQPSVSPKPVSDFLDMKSLNLVRLQCRANGLWGSLSMNSQQAASDWLTTLYQAANAAPVFMGFKLYSFPYSEVSAVGNGAIYIAPTASGPLANLSTENGSFVTGKSSTPPIQIQTASRVDQDNVLQMQCINRTSNYNPSLVSQPDAASISQYGIRKADPITNNAVQDVSIARVLLAIQVRNLQYGGDVYTFTMSARYSLLAPMDLITVTDPLASMFGIPVRLATVSEQDDESYSCTATPFVYGMNAPTALAATTPVPFQPNPSDGAGDVNDPIFLEPTPPLIGGQNVGQLWIAISSAEDNYGGCQVYVSTDGGTSYNPLGSPVVGSATTGVSTADWPAATSPDTTNNLALDLTESNGVLESYAVADEDNFVYPCYIEGGGQPIPFELMTYAVATLTAANKYTLMATGGNHLNRGVFGAPQQGIGFDHPSGSRFAFLDPSGQGILKTNMDPTWIGKTLHFKILSFNKFGGASQGLSDVSDYTYSPLGTSGVGVQTFLVNGS